MIFAVIKFYFELIIMRNWAELCTVLSKIILTSRLYTLEDTYIFLEFLRIVPFRFLHPSNDAYAITVFSLLMILFYIREFQFRVHLQCLYSIFFMSHLYLGDHISCITDFKLTSIMHKMFKNVQIIIF